MVVYRGWELELSPSKGRVLGLILKIQLPLPKSYLRIRPLSINQSSKEEMKTDSMGRITSNKEMGLETKISPSHEEENRATVLCSNESKRQSTVSGKEKPAGRVVLQNQFNPLDSMIQGTPAPLEALTPPTLMAEDDSDGFESNLSWSCNQQKREAHRKNDVRFLRNTCTETQLWDGQVNGVRLTTDHNYAYIGYMAVVVSTITQLVCGNCSNPSQFLTGRCSFNSTEHNSRSHKDSDHIVNDQNKPTHTILFKDNAYWFDDDGSRSVTA
uniref:Uncharacterized protein n=1 Tax=Brassica oleracea var. oleracea TaxID=109376 RepID=A0A0D3ATT0_BRAOL